MKSFSFIGAVALAAGASAQYSAASISTPIPTSIPGGCNPAHPGSCPSSYFQTISTPTASSPAASKPAASSPAASKPTSSALAGSVTTTITAHAGCPTGPAPDVIVTRSNVPVPSCEAGKNATKPSIISMPGYGPPSPSGSASGSGSGLGSGSGMGGSGNGTKATGTSTGKLPEFTGAAGKTAVSGVLAVIAGVAFWML